MSEPILILILLVFLRDLPDSLWELGLFDAVFPFQTLLMNLEMELYELCIAAGFNNRGLPSDFVQDRLAIAVIVPDEFAVIEAVLVGVVGVHEWEVKVASPEEVKIDHLAGEAALIHLNKVASRAPVVGVLWLGLAIGPFFVEEACLLDVPLVEVAEAYHVVALDFLLLEVIGPAVHERFFE